MKRILSLVLILVFILGLPIFTQAMGIPIICYEESYLMKEDGTYYSWPHDKVRRNGVKGSKITWEPEAKPGYILDRDHPGTILSGTFGYLPISLKAYYALLHTISFDGNGADSGSMEAIEVKNGASFKVPENKFKRSGYEFLGFNTKADGMLADRKPGQSYEAKQNETIYAIWKASSDTNYFVSYFLQNGDGTYPAEPSLKLAKKGTTDTEITLAPEESFPGYQYATSHDLNQTKLLITGDGKQEFKFYFSANTAVIKLDANTASGSAIPEIQARYKQEVKLPTNTYEKLGYSFKGWNTMADGTGESFKDEDIFTMPLEATTLYAQWEAGSDTNYFVSYFLQNGDGTYPAEPSLKLAKKGTTDTEITLAPEESFPGYQYATSHDLNQAKLLITGDGKQEFKFYFSANTVVIKLDANTASGSAMPEIQARYKQEVNLPTNTYEKLGYSFKGWNTMADGRGESFKDEDIFTMPLDATTLYAQWAKIPEANYLVQHYLEGLDGKYKLSSSESLKGEVGSTVSPVAKTLSGFTLNQELSSKPSQITEDGKLVLSLYYQRAKYLLTVGGTGTKAYTFEAEVDLSQSLDRFGYSLVGFNTKADGSGDKYEAKFKMPAKNLNLFAIWKAKPLSFLDIEKKVEVAVPADSFIDQVSMKITKVDRKIAGYSKVLAYDIVFLNEQGEEVKPAKKLSLSLPIEDLDPARLKVLHEKGKDQWEEVKFKIVSDHIVFEASDFSVYAAAELKAEESKKLVATGEAIWGYFSGLVLLLLAFIVLFIRQRVLGK